jgi:hypothetical protein
MRVTTWLTLWLSMAILQYPFVFCTGQMGELDGEVVGITTIVPFRHLMVA